MGKVDTLMDQKSKEALEDMDVHMEKLLQIRVNGQMSPLHEHDLL